MRPQHGIQVTLDGSLPDGCLSSLGASPGLFRMTDETQRALALGQGMISRADDELAPSLPMISVSAGSASCTRWSSPGRTARLAQYKTAFP